MGCNSFSLFQRQAERIKRGKAQARRGDDAEPQVQPDLVPVSQFRGSRLASGPVPSPYQQSGSGNKHRDGKGNSLEHKVARSSSATTVGAAIVEAENGLEIEVRFLPSSEFIWNVGLCVVLYKL